MRTSTCLGALACLSCFLVLPLVASACSASNDADAPDAAPPKADATAPHDAASSPDEDAEAPKDAAPDVSLPACASADGGDGGIPDELRCTGLYADWASK